MEEISPNLVKDINLQIQETQQTSNGKNIKKNMPRQIIVKLKKKKKKRERENIESKERKMTYYTSQTEKQNSNDY